MNDTVIALVPGSGLGPWIWAGLDLDGRTVIEIDYPAALRAGGTLDDYADEAVRQIDAASSGPVVLVAHSIGTVVGHAVAARLGDRAAGLLAVAGVVPATGKSFFSAFGFPQGLITSALVRALGTRPPESMLRKGLASGLDIELADRIVERFVPESRQLFRSALPSLSTTVRRGYVLTTSDAEVSPGKQHRFADRLGVTAPVELATGHLPMLEDPVALSRIVLDFVTLSPAH